MTGSIVVSGIPATGSGASAVYAIKVIDKQLGTEPYTRKQFEITALASATAATSIEALVANMNLAKYQNDVFFAKSKKPLVQLLLVPPVRLP